MRLVRHKGNREVYALKAMWKASISEAKQIEHVANERKILEQARYAALAGRCIVPVVSTVRYVWALVLL